MWFCPEKEEPPVRAGNGWLANNLTKNYWDHQKRSLTTPKSPVTSETPSTGPPTPQKRPRQSTESRVRASSGRFPPALPAPGHHNNHGWARSTNMPGPSKPTSIIFSSSWWPSSITFSLEAASIDTFSVMVELVMNLMMMAVPNIHWVKGLQRFW